MLDYFCKSLSVVLPFGQGDRSLPMPVIRNRSHASPAMDPLTGPDKPAPSIETAVREAASDEAAADALRNAFEGVARHGLGRFRAAPCPAGGCNLTHPSLDQIWT